MLFPELTVRETVEVALEARGRTGLLSTALFLPRSFARERQRALEADELIGFLGLGRYADSRIADLSTGTRRIVELAGLLALDARVLCLDEPTAGVAQRETEAFGPLIKEIRRELGAAMLVIEHDMPLIMSISDRVYCLEVGRIIAEGDPVERAQRPEGDRELPRRRRTRHRPQRRGSRRPQPSLREDEPMTTIDRRTRVRGRGASRWTRNGCSATSPSASHETGRLAARGVEVLDLPPLTFEVDGTAAHLVVADGALTLREGRAADGPVIALDATACSELFQDLASTFGLVMPGRVEVLRPRGDQFVAWEPVLRAAIDGRAVYEPGSIAFRDRHGDDLDLRRSFRIDDDREDIGHFLAEAGYLHLEGVFTESEMAAVSAELDDGDGRRRPRTTARRGGRGTEDGEWYPSRILGFNLKSPTLRELLDSDRFARIGEFTDDAIVQRDPDERVTAPKDCSRRSACSRASPTSRGTRTAPSGATSRGCCGLTVGISVTGAQQRNGELGVVAGSSRANVQPIDVRPDLDLPRIPLPTNTGDVTVHCSCTLHMSRPPIDQERRVVYTGFGLAPRPGDVERGARPGGDPSPSSGARATRSPTSNVSRSSAPRRSSSTREPVRRRTGLDHDPVSSRAWNDQVRRPHRAMNARGHPCCSESVSTFATHPSPAPRWPTATPPRSTWRSGPTGSDA